MVRTRPFKKRNIQHLGPYHKSGILKQWFPSRASIRVDFGGFSTIPVKTVFFTREGKLGFQGWGDGGKHMRFNRKTMSIHDNTNKFFRPSWPNILIPHPGTLSQNRAYLLKSGQRTWRDLSLKRTYPWPTDTGKQCSTSLILATW